MPDAVGWRRAVVVCMSVFLRHECVFETSDHVIKDDFNSARDSPYIGPWSYAFRSRKG